MNLKKKRRLLYTVLQISSDTLEKTWQLLVDEYVPSNEDQMIFLVTGKFLLSTLKSRFRFNLYLHRDTCGVDLRVLGVGQRLHFARPHRLVVQIQNATRNEPASGQRTPRRNHSASDSESNRGGSSSGRRFILLGRRHGPTFARPRTETVAVRGSNSVGNAFSCHLS